MLKNYNEEGYFNPDEMICKANSWLPHWHQDNTYIFVTYRLGDSVPQSLIAMYKEKKDFFLKAHPEEWTKDTKDEYSREILDPLFKAMDKSYGSCILRRDEVADIAEEVLMERHNLDYELQSYVIMSNHVHVLIKTYDKKSLGDIVKQWKGNTSYRINKLLGRSGPLWEREYYDTIIRNEEHYNNVVRYIWNNHRYGGIRYR